MEADKLPFDYTVPETFTGTAKKYQLQGAAFMYATKRNLLGDVTGAGKTIEAILAVCLIQKHQLPRLKVLVVTVNSAVLQWKSEIKKFTKGFRPVVITADYTKWDRREIILGLGARDICIMNYALMRNDTTRIKRDKEGNEKRVEGYLEKAGFDVVIFDEAAAFKNYQTECFKTATFLASKIQYAFGMSAYAMSNNPMEVFGVFGVIEPAMFGVEYTDKKGVTHHYPGATRFRNTYTRQKEIRTAGGGRMMVYAGGKNLSQLKERISPRYLGRTYADIGSELPALIEKQVMIQLGKYQEHAYQIVKRKLLGQVKITLEQGMTQTHFPSPQNVLVEFLHLQKITNGLRFWDPKIQPQFDENPKVEEIKRLMNEEFAGEQAVIFSKFRTYIDILEQELKEFKPLRITGAESQDIREKNKLAFAKDPSHRVLLMTTAGSMGLNLQCARVIMLVDMPFSYGQLGQIVGRIRRIGSTHGSCIVVYFSAEGTIDCHVLDILKSKKSTIEQVFGEKDLMGSIEEVEANTALAILKKMVAENKGAV